MAVFTVLLIILLIHIGGLRTLPAIRSSASCSVPLCAIGNCSSRPLCYEFQTSTNQPLCAPPVICSLFNLCTGGGTRCASNTSVCVVNSCCATPICMPLALNFTCTTDQSTDTSTAMSTSTITTSTTSTSVMSTETTTVLSDSSTTTTLATTTTVSLSCTWSPWVNSLCSVTCGTGTYSRQRYCLDQFSTNCITCTPNSDINGTRPCYYPSCSGK